MSWVINNIIDYLIPYPFSQSAARHRPSPRSLRYKSVMSLTLPYCPMLVLNLVIFVWLSYQSLEVLSDLLFIHWWWQKRWVSAFLKDMSLEFLLCHALIFSCHSLEYANCILCKLNSVVKLQFWNFEECKVLLLCHYYVFHMNPLFSLAMGK